MEPAVRTGAAPGDGPSATHPATVAANPVAPAPPLAYRPDIDGLRAVAVLSVVCYHAFPQALRGGFVGVDIFFVISGYLISTIIFSQLEAGRFSFAAFYARRIRRIFPAVLLVLAACLAFGWLAMLPDELRELGKHVAAGMGFVSNLLLWSESGYFDVEAHSKPLLHLWSLGIEEQFYIAWPLLAWLAFKRRHGLLVLVVAVLAGSFVLNVVGIGRDPVATFYSPLTRAWELAVGSLLAWAVLHRRLVPERIPAAAAQMLSVAGVVLLGVAVTVTHSGHAFPGWWATLPVLGTALVIAAGAGAWINRHVLANPVAVWIGLVSYPLYLWHWPLLYVARRVDLPVSEAMARAIAVAASFVLAALTYHVVERLVRHRTGRWPMAMLIAAGLLVAAAGAAVYVGDGLPGRAVAQRSGMTPQVVAQFTGPYWSHMSNAACKERYPYPAAEKTGWWFCVANSPRPPTLVILGNSFANQLYPGFVANPRLGHHTVLSIGNCEVAKRQAPDPGRDSLCYGPDAGEGQDYLNRVVRETPSLRFAVLAGFLWIADDTYVQRLRQRISFLERRGIQVIVFGPHIKIPFHPRECFETVSSITKCDFPVSRRAEVDRPFRSLREAIETSHPNVRFFDQNDIFCDGDRCSYVRDGLPLHRDPAGHLSEYASALLHEHFTPWARENVPELLDPDHLAPVDTHEQQEQPPQ